MTAGPGSNSNNSSNSNTHGNANSNSNTNSNSNRKTDGNSRSVGTANTCTTCCKLKAATAATLPSSGQAGFWQCMNNPYQGKARFNHDSVCRISTDMVQNKHKRNQRQKTRSCCD